MTYLIVRMKDEGEVTLYPDGTVEVELDVMTVARHDLQGFVRFNPDGTVRSSRVQDAYVYTKLKENVVQAAVKAAWRRARQARRIARQIVRTTTPPVWTDPYSLEGLCLLAEGKIRRDGWPKGYPPLERQ
jgi:hypothetical protein